MYPKFGSVPFFHIFMSLIYKKPCYHLTLRSNSATIQVCMTCLFPNPNLLRQINDLIDFSFIRSELLQKYSLDNGRTAECPINQVEDHHR